jgi:hypothetical protein
LHLQIIAEGSPQSCCFAIQPTPGPSFLFILTTSALARLPFGGTKLVRRMGELNHLPQPRIGESRGRIRPSHDSAGAERTPHYNYLLVIVSFNSVLIDCIRPATTKVIILDTIDTIKVTSATPTTK